MSWWLMPIPNYDIVVGIRHVMCNAPEKQKVSENGKVDFSLLYRFFVPNCEIFKTVLPVDFQVKLEFVLMPTKNKKQRINVFP